MTSLLDARQVSVGGRLHTTDLRIDRPSLVGLIGPNGGGKTSLLRALAGVEDGGGSVVVDGERLAEAPPARRVRLVSFLPASRDLVWPIAARDVLALGLPVPDSRRVGELIGALELEAVADRPVSELSTGERSRVLLARALAARPRLLLLDEPLANLDPYWVLRTLELLRAAVERDDCAAIVSLHDLSQHEAFDRLLLIDKGRIAADGLSDEVLGGPHVADAFRVMRSGSGWRIRPPADRRSSP